MNETRSVFEAALESSRLGRRAVLATIVNTRGSTPREVGSRMLIDLEGSLVGTVGGGCGEAQVIETAHEVFETGVAQVVRVDLTEDYLSWSPAVCGGIMDVLIERI
jgi:xanthine dehydrogenase accessory factor